MTTKSKGRISNIAIERFFRTLKYEEVYVKEYEKIKALRQGIEYFIRFYNCNRSHSALNYKTDECLYAVVTERGLRYL